MGFILTLMTSLSCGSIITLFTLIRKDYFNEFSQKLADLYGATTFYGTTVRMEGIQISAQDFFIGGEYKT